jgi:hypothetical protein
VKLRFPLHNRYILCALGFPCSSFKVTHKLQDPKQEIGEPRFPRFASKSDVFTPTRLSKIGMIRGLSVENINDKTCEFRNMIHGSAKGEANGLPDQDEAFPRLEAHDGQERLLSQKVSNVTP